MENNKAWFEIRGQEIWSNDELPDTPFGSLGEHHRYGIKLGGKWCLDYWFKIMFGISDEDWKNKYKNLRTNQDFYDLCEWLGIYYMKDNVIYRKGQKYERKEINYDRI